MLFIYFHFKAKVKINTADNQKQTLTGAVGVFPSIGVANFFLCPQRNFGRHIVIALSVRPSVRPASCPVHFSNILCGGRNSKFGVWMYFGMAECRTILGSL